METEYTFDELVNAFNAVNTAENADAMPVHIWARNAKILADALDHIGDEEMGKLAEELGA